MKMYMIGMDLNGYPSSVGCPLCGFVTYDRTKFVPHFQQFHAVPGEEYKIHEFVHPKNMMHKVYVITPEQIE